MTTVSQQLETFLSVSTQEFLKVSQRITPQLLKPAANLILQAMQQEKRIHFSGIGKPHHIAAYMASLFSSIGIPAYLLDGTEATHGSAGQVRPGDIVVCISYYGNVPELMRTITTLKKNGARILSLTGFDDSWIATQADLHLNCFVSSEGDYLNKPPRTSMLATMQMLMCLSVVLQGELGITPEEYVRFHPSGQLGQL